MLPRHVSNEIHGPALLFALLLCLNLSSTSGQTLPPQPRIELYKMDASKPLQLQGAVPNLSIDLRLVTRNADATLQVVSFPLVARGSTSVTIPPSSITLQPSSLTLQKDVPVNVTLTVTGIRRAGHYQGPLELLPKENPQAVLRLELEVAAKQPTIGVDPPELVIPAAVGATSSTRGITLTASEVVNTFDFVASDLIHTGDDTVFIDRSQIKLLLDSNQDKKLEKDKPENFSVQIGAVSHPGEYRGELQLRGPDVVRIPIRVEATAQPALAVLEDPLKLKRASSGSTILPDGWVQSGFGIYLQNTGQVPARLEGVSLRLTGEYGGFELGPEHLYWINQPGEDGPSQAGMPEENSKPGTHTPVRVPMHLELGLIPPDHYTGSIWLQFAGAKQPVKQSLDLKMKRGPLWALILILAGLLLAPVFRYYRSTGVKQQRLLKWLYRYSGWLEDLPQADRSRVETAVRGWIDEIRTLTHQKDLDEADADLTLLKQRIRLLRDIFRLEELVMQLPDAQQKLNEALRKTLAGKEQEARAAIQEAQEAIANAKSGKTLPTVDFQMLESLGKRLEKSVQETAHASQLRKAVVQRSLIGSVMHWAWRRIGVNSDRLIAETQSWVGVFVHIVLILGLAVVGYAQLYLANETFGARPLVDYAAVFLWSFGSDLASKKMSDLSESLEGDEEG